MKKIGYLLTFVVSLVLLSGCGNEKKLSCKLEGNDLGKKNDTTYGSLFYKKRSN